MSTTADFKNGLVFNHKNNLWKIVEFQHVKPGKGGAFVRTKIKNLRSGQVIEETFRSGEKIEIIRIEARKFNFLYSSSEIYYFMDNETFDQIELSKNQVASISNFLVENTPTTIAFNGEEPIEIRIPPHIDLVVKETDPGEKGNTAQGGTKPAILETGLKLMVPLFIQIGDSIKVDTRESKYLERVKN